MCGRPFLTFFPCSPSPQMDVHCFLLTDILLICKAIAKKGHGTLKVQIRKIYFLHLHLLIHLELD